MIVKEVNFNTPDRTALKTILENDIFNPIGIAVRTEISKRGEKAVCEDEMFIDSLEKKVDEFFIAASEKQTVISHLLPEKKYINRFYIFSIVIMPTGGVLLSFTAILGRDVDPAILHMVY